MIFSGVDGLDLTNNCIVNNNQIRLAVGRNFSDCTPVKGTYKGCSEYQLQVSVVIENVEKVEKTNTKNNPPNISHSFA